MRGDVIGYTQQRIHTAEIIISDVKNKNKQILGLGNHITSGADTLSNITENVQFGSKNKGDMQRSDNKRCIVHTQEKRNYGNYF